MKMNNNQMYDKKTIQNTRKNSQIRIPINVSYFSTEYFALCFAGVMVILLGLLFLTNDSFDRHGKEDNALGVLVIIIGISMIVAGIMIMKNRKIKIVGNRLIYVSMFKKKHSFNIDNIKKVEILGYRNTSEYKIEIIIDNYSWWLKVYKDCPGYEELKKYFYNKGMLSVAGLKIRPYDDENEIYSDDEN
jgi:hypothetical protein